MSGLSLSDHLYTLQLLENKFVLILLEYSDIYSVRCSYFKVCTPRSLKYPAELMIERAQASQCLAFPLKMPLPLPVFSCCYLRLFKAVLCLSNNFSKIFVKVGVQNFLVNEVRLEELITMWVAFACIYFFVAFYRP